MDIGQRRPRSGSSGAIHIARQAMGNSCADRDDGPIRTVVCHAKFGPVRHQRLALLEQVTTAVSRLDLAVDHVSQRYLNHFIRIVRAFGGPVPEGRAKAMGRDVGTVHPVEQCQHGHVAERLVRLAARKQEYSALLLAQLLDDGERRCGQWNAVLLTSLHATGRYRPDLVFDLFRSRADHLAGARRSENQIFERPCRNAVLGAQRGHECG